MKPKKIIIIGGFGWKDIGDEAMPQAVLQNLQAQSSNLEIVLMSPLPEESMQYHKNKAIPSLGFYLSKKGPINFKGSRRIYYWTRLLIFHILSRLYFLGIELPIYQKYFALIREVDSADLLFNVGGGNINSQIWNEMYDKLTMHWLAHKLGIPSILSGQTMGPYTNRIDRYVARQVLSKIPMITFRDKEISKKRLEEIGLFHQNAMDTGDDAMTLDSISKQAAEKLLFKELGEWFENSNQPIIAVNMKSSLQLFKSKGKKSGLGKEVELLGETISRLVDEYSAKIILLPTDYSEDVDDRVMHRKIYAMLSPETQEHVRCVETEYTANQLKGIISLCDMAIGARYHFSVFAASAGVPVLAIASGIYQRTKLKGLFALYNLPECYVNENMDAITPDEFWQRVNSVYENRKMISEKMMEATPEIQQNTLLTIKYAIDLLKNE